MSRITFMIFILQACGEDTVPSQKASNTPPEVSITSHTDGAAFIVGDTVEFLGMVNDADEESSALTVAWFSGTDVLCEPGNPAETGTTSCTVSITDTMSDIRLDVTDSADETVSGAISISVTSLQGPTINILSPLDGETYYSDENILFEAEIADSEDAASDLSFTWSSSVGGSLPLTDPVDSSGLLSQELSLSSGLHDITLSVEDSDGMSASETIAVIIQGPNESPNCTLVEPIDGSVYEQGALITFSANVVDINQDPIELSVEWSSSLDGIFFSGNPESSGLSSIDYGALTVGTHLISFMAADERGLTCEESFELTIGVAPSVVINGPLDGDVVTLDDAVAFSGTVSDVIDDPNDLDLSWTSSIDGVFSTQQATVSGDVNFVRSDLSAGLHDISFQAVNASGFSAEAAIQVRINTPPSDGSISFSPNPAYITDDITASVSGFTDADGDSLTYSYEWLQNGNSTIYTSTIIPASATSSGERWTLRVTPNDGYIDGPTVESFIDIFETGPSIYNLNISPNSGVVTGLTLSCSASASDSSQGTLTPSYEWSVNGQVVGNQSIYMVSELETDPGDSITCTGTASNSNGITVSSSVSVTLENTAPLVSSVSISPSSVYNDDVIQCSATVVDPDESPSLVFTWHESITPIGSGANFDLATAAIYPEDVLRCYATATDGSGASNSSFAEIVVGQRVPTDPTVVITPADPTPGADDLVCTATGSVDPDGLPVTYNIVWTSDNGAVEYSDTVLGSSTSGGETWTCTVEVSDGTSSTTVSESIDLSNGGFAQGEVMRVDGSWIDVSFEYCGPSGTCNANAAKAACTAIGKKVVSHGSNGTNEVYDLGAVTSCNWSISYYQVFQAMPAGSCLVGISNLEWSDCCGTSSWHGNTRTFGSANSVFGYVSNGNSGYQSQYSNTSGSTWGCQSEGSAASNNSNCTDHYVACTN